MTKGVKDTSYPILDVVWNPTEWKVDTVYRDTVFQLFNERLITDAEVTLSSEGNRWKLITAGSDGWYREPTKSLVISAGQTYRLDVVAGQRHAWVETTVPSPVTGLHILRDSLYMSATNDTTADTTTGRDTTGRPMERRSGLARAASVSTSAASDRPAQSTVKWDNPDRGYFFYTFELDSTDGTGWRIKSYTNGDSMIFTTSTKSPDTIPSLESITTTRTNRLRHAGRYKLTFFKPTEEFWTLFHERADTTSMMQDFYIRSFSNVTDGGGFLASFSIDSIYFDVVQ
jgi:hypothetical protein